MVGIMDRHEWTERIEGSALGGPSREKRYAAARTERPIGEDADEHDHVYWTIDSPAAREILRLAEEAEKWKSFAAGEHSLNATLLEGGRRFSVTATEIASERDRLAGELAAIEEVLPPLPEADRERPLAERVGAAILYAEAGNEYGVPLLTAENARLASENAALKETLADQQQAERWLAGCRWDARLSLLVADFRDRATLLRGSTTWEQAYRQAAIDLEEVIEDITKEKG